MSHSSARRAPVTHRTVLSIAVPVMVSNVSTPLIGIVDTAVVGRIPDPAYIGAVAVGALVFTFLFWGCGFLRMGTTGLTAQADGAGDADEVVASLGRALVLALALGAALIVLQWPIGAIAFGLLDASAQVESLAAEYFEIRIWAAPATLVNYALLGWFIGLGRTRLGLALQLTLNLTNAALDALFVLGFGWDVRGVAAGTLAAECIAAGVGLAIAVAHVKRAGSRVVVARWLDAVEIRRTLAVNADIMIRTLALILVFVWFMAQAARGGDVILAANVILMHLIGASAFFLDGLAFAAEALVGRAIGARRRGELTAAISITTLWAAGVAVILCTAIGVLGAAFIDVLTTDAAARLAARDYLAWAAFAPLLGVWAFQLDGIFIGATRTVEMRRAMLAALAVFLAAWWALAGIGNHGLWAALYVHYLARIGGLLYFYPRLVKAVPA